MSIARYLAVAVLAVGISANSVEATTITLNYDFVANGFFPEGAPVDPVTGSFSITFDTLLSGPNETRGIRITNLNIALDSRPAFFYIAEIDRLIIGGLAFGAVGLEAGSNDFGLVMDNVSSINPVFLGFSYSHTGAITNFRALSGRLTPSPVPEPATLSLLSLGLVSFAASRLWRQHRPS
jgi:hypothetical protein